MKKYIFATALAISAVTLPAAAKNSDPVLMTVDGRDIHVSEFEYLYNKNNTQQLQQQSIDEYLRLFINYKLKVADAEAEGLQNSDAFVEEFTKYRNELATPYLRDKEVEEALINEAYAHRQFDVNVSHIMLPLGPEGKAQADSIRAEIEAGRLAYEDAARKFSVDRGSKGRGGLMGFVTPDRYPWAFEKAAYDTPEGQLSEVVNSGMGYHIIRVESRTPASGDVNASHILRSTRGKSDAEKAQQKALIDSIYTLVKNGADFARLAEEYSEDPGSAKNGGSLGWFSRGMMVAEFDSTAFALADGEISAPFATAFGYHIIKRIDHKGIPALSDVRKSITNAMSRDGREQQATDAFIAKASEKYGARADVKGLALVESVLTECGGLDSVAVARLASEKTPIAHFNGEKISVADVLGFLPATENTDTETVMANLHNTVENVLKDRTMEQARADLAATEPAYRNLINEYREGILLYDISNRNVWDRAAKDTEGLEAFFKANAAKYAWDAPKFKSYVVFTPSDSLLDEAVKYAATLDTSKPAEFTQEMRKKFGRDIKVERVIAAKGENPITDFLGFGAARPEQNASGRWSSYAAVNGRVILAPEEAADVRGAAVTDYQAKLEKDWLEKLHKTYKVKVNEKEFKKLKKAEEKKNK